MTSDRERNSVAAMIGGFGWPLVLGLAACTMFYAAVFQGLLSSEFIHRYFATHPVSYAATAMFFVGLAALLLKCANLVGQFMVMPTIGLDTDGDGSIPLEECGRLLDRTEEWSPVARRSYLGGRLREALEHVDRRGTAEGLDEELKYLADVDVARQHDSYALSRIIIWATPMLGFLGTVIGITQALGDLDPKVLASDIQTAMDGLLAGLYVAFDTTALALSLSIVLMFLQFFVDQVETQLLSLVDTRVKEEVVGCFESVGRSNDPNVLSIQRMAREVVRSSESLVRKQSELWQETIEAAQQQWSATVEQSTAQVRETLSDALEQSLSRFAQRIAAAQQEAADRADQRWEQWQTALSQNARMLHAHQQELANQGEVMARVMEATGDVIKLETSLNENLKSLAGAKNFEDTVMSLAAAIHLLNTRLGATGAETNQIELEPKSSQGRAA
ncbi:MAG: MotA/TolQ/ExbB proton channel family protein [Planctomycetota bacterium]